MKSPTSSATDLKILAVIGAVAMVAVFSAPLLLGYVVLMKSASIDNGMLAADEPLGEKGSRCGGPEHLPCRPGLSCSAESGATGKCVEASEAPPAYPQLGGDCRTSDDPSCAPGLVCDVATGDSGTCKPADAASPHVSSVRLEGVQPKGGSYVGEPGAQALAHIQTINAKTVTVRLKAEGQDSVLLDVAPAEGGIWTAAFDVPNASADLIVTAIADDGKDRSSLVLHIALAGAIR